MSKPYLKIIIVIVVFVGLGAAVAYFQYNTAQNTQLFKLNTEPNVNFQPTTTLQTTNSSSISRVQEPTATTNVSTKPTTTASVSSQSTTTIPLTNESTEDTKLYINKGLHFSVRYPSLLKPDQYDKNSVDFSYNSESEYSITVTTTAFKSTQDWLGSQPNMPSKKGDGYALISWTDSNRTAIIARYIVTETDENGQPIYAKQLEVGRVENGKLYRIMISSYFNLNEIVNITPDWMDFISSFQVLK